MTWAHSRNSQGERHSLVDHLRGTAELAGQFADQFGGGEIARWLGLTHDAGKAACAWQTKLMRAEEHGGKVGIDHKTLGAELTYKRCGWPVALAVHGHHGGLTNKASLTAAIRKLRQDGAENAEDALVTLTGLLPEIAETDKLSMPEAWRDPLVGEVAVRMLFSALCDADYLDTEAHFRGWHAPRVRPPTDMTGLRDHFEKQRELHLRDHASASDTVAALREQVYRDCVAAAALPPQVFRQPAPTGAGKTISGMGFALHHAARHGHRRVVVAVPFMTITEQNAAVYRRLLDGAEPDPVVLEHHSAVNLEDDHAGHMARLAAENWDAPVVVTTFVRLFESLFGRRPAQLRRVHRLAGSVIILDEVQALRHELLVPMLDMLSTLVRHFGVTVVLSSATQPSFWALSPFADVPAADLVRDPAELAARLRRVRFEWRPGDGEDQPTLADVADRAADDGTAMVVVNTTADARTVFEHWQAAQPADTVWHLSTRMCPRHRRAVLEEVRRRLAADEPVLLVSTQLIEAGVDVDFPVVYRAIAPADSLLQAAGRANREGRLAQLGRVVVFDPADGGQPPTYRHQVGLTQARFGPGRADLHDREALAGYYRGLYAELNLEDRQSLGQRIQQARTSFDYRAVADGDTGHGPNRRDAFRLIDDEGVAVVVPQAAPDEDERHEIRATLERLRHQSPPSPQDLRRLQPYTTNLHRSVATRRDVMALLEPVFGEAVGVGSLSEWRGGYDPDTGIEVDPKVEEYVL